MDVILAIATILGGASALWFFFDKTRSSRQQKRNQTQGGLKTPPIDNLSLTPITPINNMKRDNSLDAKARHDTPDSRRESRKETIWYLPDRGRNPHFIGRTAEIESVRNQLMTRSIAAVTEEPDVKDTRRITALVGLGGIGKTQTAIEYAFQFANDYEYIFFVHADDPSKIKRDYSRIARLLDLQPWEKGVDGLVQISLEWMGRNTGWLLIVDNVDSPEQVAPLLPRNGKGHILVTSRLRTLDTLGVGAFRPVPIGLLTPEQSRELLIQLSGRTTEGNPQEEAILLELARGLDGLPVALDQAATYIRNLPCTFADYWREFNLRRTELFASPLARPYEYEGIIIADRDKAIATTWDINFRAVEMEAGKQSSTPLSAAPDLLLVSAFLSPDDIPMNLLAAGASGLGTRVAKALKGDSQLRGII